MFDIRYDDIIDQLFKSLTAKLMKLNCYSLYSDKIFQMQVIRLSVLYVKIVK